MRITHLLSGILFVAFILSSCLESYEQFTSYNKGSYIERKELMTKSIAERLSYGVTRSDVENYLVYRMNIPLNSIKAINRYIISEQVYIFSLPKYW